jgi:hypothetical protein
LRIKQRSYSDGRRDAYTIRPNGCNFRSEGRNSQENIGQVRNINEITNNDRYHWKAMNGERSTPLVVKGTAVLRILGVEQSAEILETVLDGRTLIRRCF